MKLFVGIDVSSEKLDVCFLTDDNQLSILSEISVANDIEGASFIRETILEFNDSYHFDQIVIGMESTSMYSFHPSMFFHEDEKLKKLNTLVTIENPFRVKQFSRMFDENKTDRNDALRIADFLRIQRFTTSPIKEEKYMALQRLTRTRYQLIKPKVVVTDKAPSITSAFKKLKEYGFYQGTEHRTIKYLNNLIEQDHRPVKRRNKFYRSLRTASTTIKGMEAIRGLYKKTRKEGTLFGFSVCTEIKVLLGIPA
ncbi:hypothetical protein EfmGK941_14160 [Enterococcus faecium]|nr:hypothetical protein EfmGK941_14160 [Enterococcus faecium]